MEALCSFGWNSVRRSLWSEGGRAGLPGAVGRITAHDVEGRRGWRANISAESRQTRRDVSGPSFIRFQVSHGSESEAQPGSGTPRSSRRFGWVQLAAPWAQQMSFNYLNVWIPMTQGRFKADLTTIARCWMLRGSRRGAVITPAGFFPCLFPPLQSREERGAAPIKCFQIR